MRYRNVSLKSSFSEDLTKLVHWGTFQGKTRLTERNDADKTQNVTHSCFPLWSFFELSIKEGRASAISPSAEMNVAPMASIVSFSLKEHCYVLRQNYV